MERQGEQVKFPVRGGGLFRCCVDTAATHEGLVVEGQILDCKYEPQGNAQLVFHDGAWEHNDAS